MYPTNNIHFQSSVTYEGDDVTVLSNEMKMEVIYKTNSTNQNNQNSCSGYAILVITRLSFPTLDRGIGHTQHKNLRTCDNKPHS